MTCLDTMVLIWGLQQTAAKGQEHMVDRTRRYIDHLNEEGERIVVPTPVLSEYLAGFPAGPEKDRQEALLLEGFFIASLDAPAASIAAEIAATPAARALANKGSRQAVKTDAYIIGTAVYHRCDRIVTNNVAEYRKLAGDRIQISDVPNVAKQDRLID